MNVSDMSVQATGHVKRPVTKLACEWFLPGVHSHMTFQRSITTHHLSTDFTRFHK